MTTAVQQTKFLFLPSVSLKLQCPHLWTQKQPQTTYAQTCCVKTFANYYCWQLRNSLVILLMIIVATSNTERSASMKPQGTQLLLSDVILIKYYCCNCDPRHIRYTRRHNLLFKCHNYVMIGLNALLTNNCTSYP